MSLFLAVSKRFRLKTMSSDGADQSRRFFVAVHVGAGYHAAANEKALRSVMRRACLAASIILRQVLLPL